MEDRALLSVYTVVTVNDSGLGSLQQAILDSNAHRGADSIRFQIPGGGLHTITAFLPTITDQLSIDGRTQSGFAGKPVIELHGGLTIDWHDCRIVGLAINSSGAYGISISGSGHNVIQGCFIGTDVTGTFVRGNQRGGILISGSSDNVIGTNGDGQNDAAEGNVISGNGFNNFEVILAGILIDGGHDNIIAGNRIGTDVTGTRSLPNRTMGIALVGGSQHNRIGTNGDGRSDTLERNLISGNLINGVYLSDFGTYDNSIAGNFIGTDITGKKGLGNGAGVFLDVGADFNRVGTDSNGQGDAAERNLISGNMTGLHLGSNSCVVAGNYIGTDVTGSMVLGNDGEGITGSGGDIVIGGVLPVARNVIAGNSTDGISITDSDHITVVGNFIGVNAAGTKALANQGQGVSAYHTSNLQIGGSSDAARNVLSGNGQGGIALSLMTNVSITGNFIGVDVLGRKAIGNGSLNDLGTGFGVAVDQSTAVVIGGDSSEAGNVISGNASGGVSITGDTASGAIVSANLVGTDVSGTKKIGNLGAGIVVSALASQTRIGGTATGQGNVISANRVGIELSESATSTLIQGNQIGTDRTGTRNLGNMAEGLLLSSGATNSVIGGLGKAANRIAFNGAAGVALLDDTTINNSLRGNSIFRNHGLGIDLGNDGVTPNFADGSSAGPNQFVAYPVLTSAQTGTKTRLVGNIVGAPQSQIVIDFYVNDTADPSGFGQGQRLIGSTTVSTDESGMATFDVLFSTRISMGQFVTATATDPLGNTSEFSRAIPAAR